MKRSIKYFFYFFLFCLLPKKLDAQSIFSEKDLEYKKELLPYDVPYTFALKDKEFVMLQESNRNVLKLGRYDQYFFEKWEKEIEFNKEESAPQLFIHGDSVVTYSYSPERDKKQIHLSFRYFNITDGEELTPTNYVFDTGESGLQNTKISFSEDKSKFVVYNYLVNNENKPMVEFQIFEIGTETAVRQYFLDPEKLALPKAHSAYLNNNGDLFLVAVDANEYKTETYYWSTKTKNLIQVDNTFFFERPAESIRDIKIVQQGPSSYFVSFAATIEDELIGFNVLGVNVVLKTVMFSYNQNLRSAEIASVYENYMVTSEKQKKKLLEVPKSLDEFRLVQSFENQEKDVILVFEELEIPTTFHSDETNQAMPWKIKGHDEKFYFGGDVLLYCFTESGILKWEKTIQKSQYSQGNSLSLSYIPQVDGNELQMILYESAKDGNFYILKINTIDGSLTSKTNLLPDQKAEFTKKYSCWLNGNSVIICGISPTNSNKRTLMLVEF